MNVYIKSLGNFPIADWGVCALQGFRAKEANIVLFEDILEVPLNRNSLVVSDIKDTRFFFKQMGWNVKEDLSLPKELIGDTWSLWQRDINRYSHKDIKSDYEDTLKLNLTPNIFIKPQNFLKGFAPTIVDTFEKYKEIVNLGLDVIISSKVEFISEYRCFIHDKKIKSCQHYLGDLYKYPDLTVVDEAIRLFKSAPIAYSIDVGVLDTGETSLVECNDGWSLGSYGCDPMIYSRVLAERWVEILKQNPLKQ
jgi:hypothetical protein